MERTTTTVLPNRKIKIENVSFLVLNGEKNQISPPNHAKKKGREVAPALPYPEVKAIMEMPGAAVLLIVRHPFTR